MSRIKSIKYALRNLDKDTFYCWISIYLSRKTAEINSKEDIITCDKLARTGWLKNIGSNDEYVYYKATIPK